MMMHKDVQKKDIVNTMNWELMYHRLGTLIPELDMKKYVDMFSLASIENGIARINYKGSADLEKFRDSYGDIFDEQLSWAYGYKLNAEFFQDKSKLPKNSPQPKNGAQPEKSVQSGTNKRKKGHSGQIVAAILILMAACIIGACFLLFWKKPVKEVFYQLRSSKVSEDIRVIVLSDLRGEDISEIARRTELLDPDLVLITGDMINDSEMSPEQILYFANEIKDTASVYYVFGEREWNDFPSMDSSYTLSFDVAEGTSLFNECDSIEINGTQVDIFGIPYMGSLDQLDQDALSAYRDFMSNDTDHYKILMTHAPYIIKELEEQGLPDIVVSGHTMGGYMDLPGLGPVYDRELGLFPEDADAHDYIGGRYEAGSSNVIVSAGLASLGIPRFNNDPELAVIDIYHY